MYKVIAEFRDKDNKLYKVGDEYKSSDKKRIRELSTEENNYKYPFIEKVVTRNKKVESVVEQEV